MQLQEELPMRAAPPLESVPAPRTLAYCAACGEYTPHELMEGDGVVAKLCVRCLEHEITDLLERD